MKEDLTRQIIDELDAAINLLTVLTSYADLMPDSHQSESVAILASRSFIEFQRIRNRLAETQGPTR